MANENACEAKYHVWDNNLREPTPEQTYQQISITITRYVHFPQRAVTVKPSPRTLINLDTTLTCSTANFGTQIFLTRPIGVSAVPSKLTWNFGDGTSETVDVTSRPTQSIAHRYQHLGDIKISVTVQYEARVHVAGLDWRTLPDPVSIPGPTTPLHVSEITPQLTDGTYGH